MAKLLQGFLFVIFFIHSFLILIFNSFNIYSQGLRSRKERERKRKGKKKEKESIHEK